MSRWLVQSLLLSVALTVGLNLALRLWPGGRRQRRRTARPTGPTPARPAPPRSAPPPDGGRPTVRVIVPWKAMLVASLVGTVVLNVLIRLF